MNARGAAPRLWPLGWLAAVVVLLAFAGVLPRWSGLVHLVALPPLDLFTDLRLLLTRTSSVPTFVASLAVVAAVRITVLALLLGGLTRDRLRFAALFYAAALPPLLVAATIDFGSHAVLYSRAFWVAVAVVVVVMLVAAPAPWQRAQPIWQIPPGEREEPRLRVGLARSLRRGLRLEVTIPYAAVVVGVGVLADLSDGWVAVLLVPVSAAATAVAISALTRPVKGRPLVRLGVAGLVAVLAGTAFVATRTVAPPPPPAAAARSGSLFIMSGINSSSGSGSIFETEVATLGFDCDQVYYFSYAGPGDGAPQGDATCPIQTGAPYRPGDTLRPVPEQVDLFAAQVRDLPRPLVVAGHSLAAFVAWQAVATGQAPQVDVLILAGPFPDSPVGFPPVGEDGAGRVAGDLMRLLVPLAQAVDFHFQPDAPAARDLLATPNAASRVFARPLPPRVRVLSMTTSTDLPLMPSGWRMPVDRNACPVREAHPYLPETPAFYHEVNRFLDGEPPLPCPRWRDWGAPMARPFGVPPAV